MGQKGEVGNDSPCTLAKQVKQLADKRNCETCALAEKKEKGQSYGQEAEKVSGVVECCQLDNQKRFAFLTQGQEPPCRKASKLLNAVYFARNNLSILITTWQEPPCSEARETPSESNVSK